MQATSKTPVYSNVEEMFDAIRGEDGVLRPTQFVSNGEGPISLAEALAKTPSPPQDSPRTSTPPDAGK